MKFLSDSLIVIIMIPALLLIFFYDYPFRWKDRKFLFGVRNREEFQTGDAAGKVEEITGRARNSAVLILAVMILLAAAMFLVPDLILRMIFWTILTLMGIVLIYVPFMKANGEMKGLKKELGIISRGISYADLTNAGTVHALKLWQVLLPNVVGLLLSLFALLFDTKLLSFGNIATDGSFALTIMSFSMLFCGLLMIPIALILDRGRIEVISESSTVNANYNRAKKKIWADFSVIMAWLTTGFIAVFILTTLLWNSEPAMVLSMVLYFVALMIFLFRMVRKAMAVDRTYRKEHNIAPEDDDYWLLGNFYYNPEDTRINVEKRAGIGGTINLGHPIGKVIGVVCALTILFSVVAVICAGFFSRAPLSLKVNDGSLICHQVWDTSVIPLAEIEEAELCEDFASQKFSRIVGVAADPIYSGKYMVNGERDCRLFLNTEAGCYIRFTRNGKTWYVSASTAEETKEAFLSISGK